jgi:phospholipid/cholesterol/gamma-HCH transport system ATP-binding protein
MTTGDNVALPLEEWTALRPEAIRAIVRAKLRLVGLEGAEGKLPAELSGGMRKRAAIARALALEPELVFLDEPTSGLDPVTGAEMDGLIAALRKTLGLTVVVVTHDLESIFRIADRVILLDKDAKTAIASGEPRVLRESTDPRVSRFFNPKAKVS